MATKAPAEPRLDHSRPPTFGHAQLGVSAVVLSIVINVLWGTNPTVLKIALRGLPPIGAAGLRFAIAAVGVWAWCLATRVEIRPRRGELPWLLAVGGLFTMQIATFSLGVHWGTASHSVVILHTYPFFVVALAHFLIPGDRASPGRVAGLVAAFAGVLILFLGKMGAWRGDELRGDSVQLFSAFILGLQVIFTKHAVSRIAADRVVLWQMLTGTVVFLLYSFTFEGLAIARPDLPSVLAVVYQGSAVGALCFTIWTLLIRRHAASRIAVFGFIGPLVGVFLSALVLGEPLTPSLLIGAGLVAAGIVLANVW